PRRFRTPSPVGSLKALSHSLNEAFTQNSAFSIGPPPYSDSRMSGETTSCRLEKTSRKPWHTRERESGACDVSAHKRRHQLLPESDPVPANRWRFLRRRGQPRFRTI